MAKLSKAWKGQAWLGQTIGSCDNGGRNLVALSYILYTRPFLVMSCSDSDTDVTNNIIVGSIASSFDCIPSLWTNPCSKPYKVRQREICHT